VLQTETHGLYELGGADRGVQRDDIRQTPQQTVQREGTRAGFAAEGFDQFVGEFENVLILCCCERNQQGASGVSDWSYFVIKERIANLFDA
jgi:hypothetical protein